MILVDSFGWIEYFTGGALADEYEKYLADPTLVITPTVVLYEVCKKIRRERSEEELLVASLAFRTFFAELTIAVFSRWSRLRPGKSVKHLVQVNVQKV